MVFGSFKGPKLIIDYSKITRAVQYEKKRVSKPTPRKTTSFHLPPKTDSKEPWKQVFSNTKDGKKYSTLVQHKASGEDKHRNFYKIKKVKPYFPKADSKVGDQYDSNGDLIFDEKSKPRKFIRGTKDYESWVIENPTTKYKDQPKDRSTDIGYTPEDLRGFINQNISNHYFKETGKHLDDKDKNNWVTSDPKFIYGKPTYFYYDKKEKSMRRGYMGHKDSGAGEGKWEVMGFTYIYHGQQYTEWFDYMDDVKGNWLVNPSQDPKKAKVFNARTWHPVLTTDHKDITLKRKIDDTRDDEEEPVEKKSKLTISPSSGSTMPKSPKRKYTRKSRRGKRRTTRKRTTKRKTTRTSRRTRGTKRSRSVSRKGPSKLARKNSRRITSVNFETFHNTPKKFDNTVADHLKISRNGNDLEFQVNDYQVPPLVENRLTCIYELGKLPRKTQREWSLNTSGNTVIGESTKTLADIKLSKATPMNFMCKKVHYRFLLRNLLPSKRIFYRFMILADVDFYRELSKVKQEHSTKLEEMDDFQVPVPSVRYQHPFAPSIRRYQDIATKDAVALSNFKPKITVSRTAGVGSSCTVSDVEFGCMTKPDNETWKLMDHFYKGLYHGDTPVTYNDGTKIPNNSERFRYKVNPYKWKVLHQKTGVIEPTKPETGHINRRHEKWLTGDYYHNKMLRYRDGQDTPWNDRTIGVIESFVLDNDKEQIDFGIDMKSQSYSCVYDDADLSAPATEKHKWNLFHPEMKFRDKFTEKEFDENFVPVYMSGSSGQGQTWTFTSLNDGFVNAMKTTPEQKYITSGDDNDYKIDKFKLSTSQNKITQTALNNTIGEYSCKFTEHLQHKRLNYKWDNAAPAGISS